MSAHQTPKLCMQHPPNKIYSHRHNSTYGSVLLSGKNWKGLLQSHINYYELFITYIFAIEIRFSVIKVLDEMK